jgi:hypothetical protein
MREPTGLTSTGIRSIEAAAPSSPPGASTTASKLDPTICSTSEAAATSTVQWRR